MRLSRAGLALICTDHPGMVGTNLVRGGLMGLVWSLTKPFHLSPERGAQMPLWAATTAELTGATGQYYKKRAPAPMSPLAQEPEVREMVWARTLDLAGLRGAELASTKANSLLEPTALALLYSRSCKRFHGVVRGG